MEGLPERFGKYHVLERIAQGGMAEIYMVKTVGIAGFEKVQALKRILPAFAQRARFIRSFIDEARIAVELNHRNIVQVFDFGRAAGELYLAMELIDGVDLRTAIRDAAKNHVELPIALSCYVLGEVAAGLDYAHRKTDAHGRNLHIVHCDVSPQNIMLSHEGFVKILDFGVARARFGTAPKERRLRGKPRYMAPEQTRGEPPTAATDVFALGIIIWELLTGLPLFDGHDLSAILASVRRADAPAVDKLNPDVPTELADAVSRALSAQQDQRGTAADLAGALHNAVGQLAAGTNSRTLADWLGRVYPPPVREETGQTRIEVPVAPAPASRSSEYTLNTSTLSRPQLEDIDEEVSAEASLTLMDRRRVVVVVLLASGGAATTRRELLRMLADLAYKRSAVLHDQREDSLEVVFGLEIAGEDNLARALGYALDAVEVSREAAAVSEGALTLRVAARAGIVAQRLAPPGVTADPRAATAPFGYHLVGGDLEETRALARDAEPGRPLLSGGAGRLTSAHFAFRELPARRLRRQRLRLLELIGRRSFDERDRALRERQGRFVGRDSELGRLDAALSRAVAEDRRLVVSVTGRAGVGKSRLVDEFLRRAGELVAVVPRTLLVVATPAGQVAPFSVVTELFETALNLPPGRGAAARARVLQRLRHVMSRAEGAPASSDEAIDEVVTALELAMELRDGALLSNLSASADLRERLSLALGTFRTATRPGRPVITVIEDLHFADATSAEVLRSNLAPPPADGAELLILTSRPLADEDSAAAQLVGGDDRESIEVVEMEGDDQAELIRDRLADSATGEAVAAVASRAGGNPFFIEELAGAVREVGFGEIPPSAREVIVARVDRLPATTKAALQHAAVIGRTFRARILEELLGTDLNADLRALLDEGLLMRADRAGQEANEGELAFAHGLFQEVVYQSLSAAARRATHAKLGKLLSWRYQAGREEPPATIAHHLELGGQDSGAAAYWLRAGRVALAASDASAAVEAFCRTLEIEDRQASTVAVTAAARARRREALAGRERAYGQLGDHEAQARDLASLEELARGSPRQLAEVKNRAAERLLRLGDYAAAAACTEEAEREAEQGADERTRGEALRLRGEAYERQGEYERALETIRRALDIFKRIGAVTEETRAMIGGGRVLLMRAQYEAAQEAYVPILERINDTGDPWLERIVHNHLSVINLCLGDFERAMVAAERSLEICRRLGDRAREGDNVSVCGIILLEVGRYAEASQLFTDALDMLDRTGSRWSRADCLVYAGTALTRLGDFPGGLALLDEAVALAHEIGAKYIEANALVALAAALLRHGENADEIDRALEAATRATMISREASLLGPEIQSLSRQAEAIWRAGYRDAALALSTRAIRLLHKQRYVEGSEEEILYTHYQLLDAIGSPEAASMLERAWQGFQTKLTRLTRPEWQHSYAAEIPLHVALSTAYQKLSPTT